MSKRNRKRRQVGRKPVKETRPQLSPPMAQISVPAHQGNLNKTASYEQPPERKAPIALGSPAAIAPFSTGDAEPAVPTIWQVGDVILEQYEVMDKLGEGGMGTVYKVHHRGWNTDLAVKCPKPEIFARAGGKKSFIDEAETWVNLGLHPHIVSCYYVRTLGGIPRVFAEYVKGGSLSDWTREGRLYAGRREQALERILDIAIQFAWGLHYAHEQGLIHQDVKPDNVMMTPDGIAKVTDFGLAQARAMAGETGTQGQAGQSVVVPGVGLMTPEYASPEQARGEPLTRKTDIWSWAASVLELFTGEATWLGQAAGLALESYLEEGPKDYVIPVMPASLVALLRHCFQRDPAGRPANMNEVATALQNISAQELGHLYLRQVPKPAEALAASRNNWAITMLDLGKTEKAEELWKQALQADPLHIEASYNLGLFQWRSGKITDDTLIKQLEHIRQLRQVDWPATYLLGLIHIERGDFSAALHELQSITTLETTADQEAVAAAIQRAKDRLPATRKRLRIFGESSIDADAEATSEHSIGAHSVSLSRDGRFAVSGLLNTLQLWEVATGRCLYTFTGHKEPIYSACLSSDGRFALSGGSFDRSMKLWEVATGRCLQTFGHNNSVTAICLAQHDQLVISGCWDATITIWNINRAFPLLTIQDAATVSSVHASQDGRYILSGGWDKTVKLWEVSLPRFLDPMSAQSPFVWQERAGISYRCVQVFEGHKGRVRSVCLSVDGRFALSGSDDKTIKLWDTATGHCLRTYQGHETFLGAVCFSTDGKYIVSAGGRTLRLWEIQTGRCLCTLASPRGFNHSLCLSQDGQYALTGSGDDLVKVWAINTALIPSPAPMMLARISTSENIFSAEIQYKHLVKQAQESLAQRDYSTTITSLKKARSLPGYNRGGEVLDMWASLYDDLPRKEFVEGWEKATFRGHDGAVRSVCMTEDGQYALSGGEDQTVKLWEVSTGRCLHTFTGHTNRVDKVFLSQDGRYAFSESADGTLRQWDIEKRQCVHISEKHSPIDLIANTTYALGCQDSTPQLWDTATGSCLRTFEKNNTLFSSAIRQSPDGRYVLSGCQDYSLKLWEVATGRCVRRFIGHTHYVTAVCMSRDGHYALSGSGDRDGTMKLWEIATGRCVRTFEADKEHIAYVRFICLTADGHYAVTAAHTAFGKEDTTFKLWEVATGRCLFAFELHAREVQNPYLSPNGRYILSGSLDGSLKLRELHWELEIHEPADWDEGAWPYLETFLTLHTPYAGALPRDRNPSEQEIQQALTHYGRPCWIEQDFQKLIRQLQYAGYGWLRPEGVRRKLEEMTASWEGPPPLPNTQLSDSPVADAQQVRKPSLWSRLFRQK